MLNTTGITQNNDNIFNAITQFVQLEGGQIFFPMILIVFAIILYASLSTRYSSESSLMATFFMSSIMSLMLVMSNLAQVQVLIVFVTLTITVGFIAIMRK